MILSRFRKQPSESQKHTIDYAARVTGTRSLGSSAVDISPVTDPPLVAGTVIGTDRPVVQSLVSGGVDGTTYTLAFRVGVEPTKEQWEDEIQIVCSEVT